MNLFDLQIPENKLHPNFINVANDPELVKVIERWAKGFVDRDDKFVKQFQETFNSSFWEIYLYACFNKLNFHFDFSHQSPDFLMSKKGYNLVVEAVSTGHAKGFLPEHEKLAHLDQTDRKYFFQSDIEEMHEEVISMATERISNSINNKHKRYIEYYQHLPYVMNKPYMLAIGAFEQPFFYTQKSGAISRVLYGLQSAKYAEDGQPDITYGTKTSKHNGAELSIGLFNDKRYDYISAVLFNPIATIGKVRAQQNKKSKGITFDTVRYNKYGYETINENGIPHKRYHESLLDGTYLFINPNAKNPIDHSLFDENDITVWFDAEQIKSKHRFLYTRNVWNSSSFGKPKKDLL